MVVFDKYSVLLNDSEVEEILQLDSKIEERINWFKSKYELKDMKDAKVKFIFSLIQGSQILGDIKNNLPDLKCPNCDGKYVVTTYSGDLFYRLFNGSSKQKKEERKKLSNMGLYSNPYAISNNNTRNYLCLNCGIRWNGINDDVYRNF